MLRRRRSLISAEETRGREASKGPCDRVALPAMTLDRSGGGDEQRERR